MNKEISLAKNIKDFSRLKRLRNRDMTKLAGISEQTLFNWPTGLKPRNIDDVRKLSEVLGVSLYFLLYGENESSQNDLLNFLFFSFVTKSTE